MNSGLHNPKFISPELLAGHTGLLLVSLSFVAFSQLVVGFFLDCLFDKESWILLFSFVICGF
jgi:hypothetical protein